MFLTVFAPKELVVIYGDINHKFICRLRDRG